VPQDRFVELPGLRLHLRVWQGQPGVVPVVLLPATGETAQDWDVVAAPLSATRTVYAVDLPGHGSSSWTGRYSTEGMADAVVALLRALGDEGAVDLVGHSLGGLVALRAAAAAPQLVRRLVLEDVGVLHPREAAPPERPPGRLDFDWRVVEQVRPQIDEPSSDWNAVLAAVTAPTLVIAGGVTSPVPAAHVAELISTVAHGQQVTVDAGHHVHAAEPEGFLRELLLFLDT
jgi:pimeloyl-ACP methyl ester carboxylesterase